MNAIMNAMNAALESIDAINDYGMPNLIEHKNALKAKIRADYEPLINQSKFREEKMQYVNKAREIGRRDLLMAILKCNDDNELFEVIAMNPELL